MDRIEELLLRGVANIIPDKKRLQQLLASGKKLNIYLGIDPTATKIHLGHAVPLRKLQSFAELDHKVTFLIGDFTALIGDTSDKDTERPVLTSEEIQENFQTYKTQAEKIVDFSKVTVRHNSEWLEKLSISDFIKIAQKFSFGDFASRELIKKRLQEGKYVGLHEALYPAMQGYDSYFMDTDIQIGGTDQTFNMQAGRILQKQLRSKESFILATEFLMGTDGRKMSKTWGNAVWLDDTPNDMYAKVMAINDDLILQYFTLGTSLSLEKINEIKNKLANGENPLLVKKQVAHTIVSEMHSKTDADAAQNEFEKTVQKKETPTDIKTQPLSNIDLSLVDVIVEIGFADSKSDAKRKIEQGGIRIDGKTITDPSAPINSVAKSGAILQVGKIKFVKITW